ncbi:O-antigen ligase family protein [Kocuria salina]|uniref:O-antigen ligase family protein n=1 Tax=Kocuria salina TaxID=1929416 RepID=UPI0034E87237|nr:O-antigen ligase family protein [Kocuria salina]
MAYLYATLGVLALGLTLSSLRVHWRAKAVDSTFLYFVALTILPSLAGLIAQLTGGRQVTVGFGGATTVSMSGAALAAASVTPALVLASAVTYLAARVRREVRINTAAALLGVILVAGIFGHAHTTQGLPAGPSVLTYVAAAPLLLAPRNLSGLFGSAHALGVLMGLSGIAAILAPDAVMVECDLRKCGPLGHLFSGASYNFNSFGMLAALAVPVLYLGLSRFGLPVAFIAAILGLSSGSRTSQLAIILTFALILVHSYTTHAHRRLVLPIFVVGVAGPAALSVVLPFSGLDPVTFTGRSGLWDLALMRIADYPLLGLGPDSWPALQATGDIARASAYSPHNQLLDVLFVGGAIGLLAFAVFVAHVVHSNRAHLTTILLLFAPAATLSITERPWSTGRLDWVSWSLFLTASVWLNARATSTAKAPRTPLGSVLQATHPQRKCATSDGLMRLRNEVSPVQTHSPGAGGWPGVVAVPDEIRRASGGYPARSSRPER